jgi:DNA-binding CsgD family transcriptional regulator
MAPAVPAVSVTSRSDGLLERASQLTTLEGCLAGVERDGRGRVALVAGEAGVGKTALVRLFCEEGTRSARVLWAACDPLFTPRPLGPLSVIAEGTAGELKQVVRRGATPYDVVLALVGELRSGRPTLFVLEDLHWADEATLDVFLLLVRRIATVPALVVGTYRDDALERSHPLRRVLGELATTQGVRRLPLGPLSREAVHLMAAPHGVEGRELYEKTGGNPFFVVEVLAAGAEEMPATVREAVLARARPLSFGARELLDAVAVVPQRAELWLVEAMAGGSIQAVDECVSAGMLVADPAGVAFRHELARLSIEESVSPGRKTALHRKALATLADRPGGGLDPARLAHHAEAAGDTDAVLRFAAAGAERAASMGAHREAAAQYARVLRFGDGLALAARAELLERRSYECYLTDQNDDAVAAVQEALRCRRQLGDKLGEGTSLCLLSEVVWCTGRTGEAERAAREAVAVLEQLPASGELAKAYARVAGVTAMMSDRRQAVVWARRALQLSAQVGEAETAIHARRVLASEHPDGGIEFEERILEEAERAGLVGVVGSVFYSLVATALSVRRYDLAARHLATGMEYCGDHGLELVRLYLLAHQARLHLDQGRWEQAAETARSVLCIPRASITPRIMALVVLGLVRARRGDPGHRPLLDEAWALAEPTGVLTRLGRVAAGRAEAAWLGADRDGVASATEPALPLASERWPALADELAVWRRRAGLNSGAPLQPDGIYGLQLAGKWDAASALWAEAGCPYEAALALCDTEDEAALRRALEDLQRLEARPAVAIVTRRLRERGVISLPRGPNFATRQNQYGLTGRELEVLALVNEGFQNSQIADHLVVSVRTVDHHVEAILRKLGARTRADARAMVTSAGIAVPRR